VRERSPLKKDERIKLLILMGTRPEVIKLAPVVHELKKKSDIFDTAVCFTAQHRHMCDPFLDLFTIKPDYDLDVMIENQSLSRITTRTIERLNGVLDLCSPDAIIIQGDTTSAVASSLAAFYRRIKVFHVEAGLRSYSRNEPFPEEINRQIITRTADYHFAPTARAKNALISEGISDFSIFVTGNTVIDALEYGLALIGEEGGKVNEHPYKKVLVTIHRRENLENGIVEICRAINEIVNRYSDVRFIFPMHINPAVREKVHKHLNKSNKIELVEQLDYLSMLKVIKESFAVMTDSGGLQEEVPFIGRPLMVLRNVTERMEIIEQGSAVLAGVKKESILREFDRIYNDEELRKRMSRSNRIYGDGRAAWRIVRFVELLLNESNDDIESVKKEVEYSAGQD